MVRFRREVLSRLRDAGLEVSEIRTSETFAVLQVKDREQTVVVDLVAEPVASIEAARPTPHLGAQILVDTPHEVLVNRLCALLHRSELRDLLDIEALLDAGGDLELALADAPRKDGGFSALTLGWSLQGWKVADVARDAGMEERAEELEDFRDRLLTRVAGGRP